MMNIRTGEARDLERMLAIHREAFGDEEGPEIVELMRELLLDDTAQPVLSLVAEVDGQVEGHVLFTAVRIDDADPQVDAQILAPLAVSPALHATGIGGALVREGLRRLAESGVGLVFVLGHPTYYPRFGFEPAGRHGLLAPYPIPAAHEEAWMVLALREGLLGQVRGTLTCARTLSRPEYW